ncbi:hypothetical protein HA402_006588 [Bradysia odoriphaga]|nr:hypothetical protein HA402_006588 [Bradysia odoriphaga]
MKWLIVPLMFLSIGLVVGHPDNGNNDLALPKINKNKFALEYLNYYRTGVKSLYLKNALNYITFPQEARMKEADDISPENQDPICTFCNVGLQVILLYIAFGATNAEVGDLAFLLCMEMEIQERHVCRGLIDVHMETVGFIIRSNPAITSELICGMVFQGSGCEMNENEIPEWSINIDPNGRPINGSKSLIPSPSSSDITVVHITDTHYDPKYQAGARANCGVLENPEDGAGYWGDYRDCDSPWIAVLDVFTQINQTHPNITYVYYTGDVVDHGVWETSHEANAASMSKTFSALTESFPNIPIYPIIGNHEPHPVNQFAPDNINSTELSSRAFYRFIADEWNDWLPAEARITIEEDGFYTVLVQEGLRIIAINNNDCYTYNFWLLYNASYPAKQLQWLHDTLLEAETNNEKVHILAHIPSGEGGCYNTWAREYRRIVDRFWDTISAQFNGHTHRDEFNVFYARDSPKDAINVGWNGGSATPYSFVNPNYRIYTVETETYQVIGHETWIYNLTEANLNASSSPNWFREYSFIDAYNVADLSPASLDELMTSFATDPDLISLYWMHKVKMGDPSLEEGCENECLLKHLTEIVTTEFGAENPRRDELVELFWTAVGEDSK